MHDVLAWLQASALGMFMRDSGPSTYPVVNLIHILGVATLFGAVLILDLRLLGVWRRAPLPPITTAAAPVAMAGFALAAASGVCLLAANAVEYENNPFLLGEVCGNRAGTRQRRRAAPHGGVEGPPNP